MRLQSTELAKAQQRFESWVPQIKQIADYWCRSCDDREEFTADVLALAWKGFLQCLANGNRRFTVATLANYACRQVRDGRTVHCCHGRSITGRPARQRGALQFGLTDYIDERDNPAEVVAIKIDFPAWLAQLPVALRATADTLISAGSDPIGRVLARKLGISQGRLSQRRRQLREDWELYTA